MPKRGNSPEEYEDFVDGDKARGRFAIADGASESFMAGLWAKNLVNGFIELRGESDSLGILLPSAQQLWAKQIGEGPFPWFIERKVQEGAFATFLGLVLEEESRWILWKKKYWRAIAVGDGCLFLIREGELIKKFPLETSEDFNDSPWLLGSRKCLMEIHGKNEQEANGELKTEDMFWMMTDALACWFFKECEAGHKPWEKLGTFLTSQEGDQDFAAWVDELRNNQEIQNDDVTLLAIFV